MARSARVRSAAGALAILAASLAAAACSADVGVVDRPALTTTTFFVDPEARQGVTPGAFCSPEGSRGQTETGKIMVCTKGTEDRARWRAS